MIPMVSKSQFESRIHNGTLYHHHSHQNHTKSPGFWYPGSNRIQIGPFHSVNSWLLLLLIILVWFTLGNFQTITVATEATLEATATIETDLGSNTIQELGSNLCDDEFHKECHCGSIAMPPATTLFTRIAYPNSTIVIEEYDEDVPYGYKYLRVYYRCTNRDNILVGNNMRECSKGNWIGNVPRCAINNMNRTRLKQINIRNHRWHPPDPNPSSNNNNNSSTSSSDADDPEPSISSSLADAIGEITSTSNGNNVEDGDEEESNRNDPIWKSFNTEPLSVLTIFYNDHLPLEPNGVFAIPLSNQPVECLRWSLAPRQVWSMTLTKPTIVHYVRIKLFGDHIEDLHLKHEIEFELILKNLTYQPLNPLSGKSQQSGTKTTTTTQKPEPAETRTMNYELPPIERIKCRQTIPKTSQFETYHQKYSANYLVLDWICETDIQTRSFFDFFFQDDIDIDQVFASVIEIRFMMLDSHDKSSKHSFASTGRSNSGNDDNQHSSSSSSESTSGASGSSGLSNEFPFKPKIFVTSLCELKLYSFNFDCGMPDIPVTAIVQRDYKFVEDIDKERKSYKYICSDKNYEVKGTSNIECSYYGKWKTDFPQCVPVRPCALLANSSQMSQNGDYHLEIKYEKVMVLRKSRRQVVPNGKYARLSCLRTNQTTNANANVTDTSTPVPVTLNNNDTMTPVNGSMTSGGTVHATLSIPFHQGVSQIICQNGKWVGIKSINPNCRSIVADQANLWLDQDSSSMQIRQKPKSPTSNGDWSLGNGVGGDSDNTRFISTNQNRNKTGHQHTSVQLVSLPVRVIQVLLALFVMLCLVIVSLLVYMAVFRKRLTQLNSLKANQNFQSMTSQFGLIGFGDSMANTHNIPTIVYNHHHGNDRNSNSIYSSASNFYERISLERDSSTYYDTPHLYQTIGAPNQNRISSSNSLAGMMNRSNSFGNFRTLTTDGTSANENDYGSDSGSKIFGHFNVNDCGEERVNSIYGDVDENDIDDNNCRHPVQPESETTAQTKLSELSSSSKDLQFPGPKRSMDDIAKSSNQQEYATVDRRCRNQNLQQQQQKEYNQLSRSSSMFMKQNSIYEQ